MKAAFLLVIGVALVAIPAAASAQAHHDYSGKWALSQSKSTPGAAGNGATISFGSELVITQTATELKVEARFPRVEETQTMVFKFDGSEVTHPLSEGVVEKAKAVWDGDKVMITARRVVSTQFGDFVSETKETWTRSGNLLTIDKTVSSDGFTDTQKAVFDRQP
ncbi:MAG TPA: hypothetical protein VMZ90_15375 [Vicinamibacterales bacterium]|nr:hypothetical protein [Vicinamibacterales bacterium]